MEEQFRPKDSVRFLPEGKIEIAMNIQIRGYDLSKLELFESPEEAISWIDNEIAIFGALFAGKVIKPFAKLQLTREEATKLISRHEDVKQKILVAD